MPRVPSVSPATGNATSPDFIHTIDGNFVDTSGRTLLLRGINLAGSAKAPVGEPSYILDGFWEDAEGEGKTFLGRPLNLDDGSADLHLARLRGWGFNVLRYPITWESLEHAGPGKYDYEFMDYTIRVLRKCKEYGFKVFIDPHQDIWSRFSGGSGAPYWTLPACGINPRNFTATQTAILHCEYPSTAQPDPASLPAMQWSTNYGRLASQTLLTFFFAGRAYAPKCILDGQNIQDYLQSHFVEAFGQLADRLRAAGGLLDACVVGWDSMNEPAEGLIGCADLRVLPTEQGSTLKKGTAPTPAQSLRLGMGQAQTVENWAFGQFGPKRAGSVTVDPKGRKMWADAAGEPGGVHPRYGWRRDPGWALGECIWAQHGVWDVETGYVMRPDYFKMLPREDGCDEEPRDVAFIADFWRPHWQAYAARVRAAHPEAILFVAPPVFAQPPPLEEADLRGRCCYSTHYYDGLTLVTRHWNWFNADALGLLRGKYRSQLQAVKIGERAIRKSLREQLGELKADAEILGAYPTIIGEIGVPYDMDQRRAYGWTHGGKHKGDYSRQQRALDASLNAADGPNALNYAIWTYCPDHTHPWGDGWNMEDLSVWSPDDLRPRGAEVYAGHHLADKSSAALLRAHNNKDARRAPSAVSVSVASLSPTADDAPRPEITDAERWESAYDFLTDGARAARAFSRPYPAAVVGRAADIQFDADSAEFKLKVCVRAQDAPVAPQTRTPESAGSETTHGKDAFPATEVFLPVVHYASDATVGALLAAPPAEQEKDEAAAHARRSSDTLATEYPPGIANTVLAPRGLAVDVHVSDGRWELEGSVLKWWYPVPAPGEPDREYMLAVRRQGGRIWTAEEHARLSVFEKVWLKVKACCGLQ